MKPLFRLALAIALFPRTHIHAQELPCSWSNVERIVVVSDIHADGDLLIACLRAGGVMDEQQKWIGGKTHLVQLGDLLDPGPDLKKIMDLLMALEVQAKEAGGRVHALIGNHELMLPEAAQGDLETGEAASFGGGDEYKDALQADGKYGKWICSHNAVIRINDILFVHAGLSSDYAAVSLEEINQGVREGMCRSNVRTMECGAKSPPGFHGPAGKEQAQNSRNMAHDPRGPLWFRGLATEEAPQKIGKMVAPILRDYGVKHIVVGHTVTQTRKITIKAGGALILTDTGMSETYGGGSAVCLVIEKGGFFSVTAEKRQNLLVE